MVFPIFTAQISYLKGFYRGYSIPAEVRQEFSADGSSETTQEAFLSYFQNFHASQEYFEPRAHELDVQGDYYFAHEFVLNGKNVI